MNLPQPEDWTEQALCAQVDVGDMFFPEKGAGTREAKAVCNGTAGRPPCPVKDKCLASAMKNDERFGVWGGLSEHERDRLRRKSGAPRRPHPLQPITHGTPAGYTTHRRRGEEACRPCLDARSLSQRLRLENGERARRMRAYRAAGLSTSEIAERLGVTPRAVERTLGAGGAS